MIRSAGEVQPPQNVPALCAGRTTTPDVFDPHPHPTTRSDNVVSELGRTLAGKNAPRERFARPPTAQLDGLGPKAIIEKCESGKGAMYAFLTCSTAACAFAAWRRRPGRSAVAWRAGLPSPLQVPGGPLLTVGGGAPGGTRPVTRCRPHNRSVRRCCRRVRTTARPP